MPHRVGLNPADREFIAAIREWATSNGSLLVLDEATSAVDNETEAAIQRSLARAAEGRTTLVIAHRLATVKKADRIVVMEDGRIVAQGSHDDLVSQGGLYARLARLQFTDGIAAE